MPTTDYDAQVLALAPDGYWKLDETSGLVFADSSGGGNSLTAGAGAVERYSIPGPSTVNIPTATDFLNVAPPAAATGTLGQRAIGASWSIEFWFGGVGAIPSAYGVLEKGYNVAEQRPWYSLGINTSGFAQFWFRDVAGTDYVLSGYTNLSNSSYELRGPYHHVVGTYTAGTADLYVDGVREAQLAVPNTGWGTGVQPLALGRLAGSIWGGPWLADVAIYPGQLSSAQVLSNWELGHLGSSWTLGQIQNELNGLSEQLLERLDQILAAVYRTFP